MLHRLEGLHLYEQDSTVLVHFFSIGDFDVHVDLCVEFYYLWVRRGRGAARVSFNNESFGGFRGVRYHVRDVTLGNVVLCRDEVSLLQALRHSIVNCPE